jgi:NADH-quinone oxidoreductase subunit H
MYEIITNLLGNEIIAYSITALLPLLVFILPFAIIAVYLERKISAHMQDRLGPMRVGYHVFYKLLPIFEINSKEDITAEGNDKLLFNLAPVLVFAGFLCRVLRQFLSHRYILAPIPDLGLFYIVAVSGIVVAGI